ncbi:TetR/AcrR family transcriptional regulator [Bradyrhizobium sp. AS23.2]|uniref:TetR/AcrR family transcriptional regulator n=1 Tax=Bradyrhizobium sp. AS23.2 TaxID=1680155 RepID=UPI00093EC75A|nr:TetR/AcrR family transcriptional regulator [Bradyrhizobium sp. AS23.2]OKO85591.1 TetR family transcriptional regulator [Bradyrhizobium sp. AS23.2]
MTQNDQRIAGILDAALPVFVRYGFRKTSMADIAKAAGISRASLYLAFSNKEELFRAGSARAHARAMDAVSLALSEKCDVVARIEAAMTTFQRSLIAPFGGSAEAEELFTTNMALAQDITLDTRTQLLELLASHLSKAEQNGEIDLSRVGAQPKDLADMIVAAMDGLKHMRGAGAALEDGTRLFMRILRAATATPRTAI